MTAVRVALRLALAVLVLAAGGALARLASATDLTSPRAGSATTGRSVSSRARLASGAAAAGLAASAGAALVFGASATLAGSAAFAGKGACLAVDAWVGKSSLCRPRPMLFNMAVRRSNSDALVAALGAGGAFGAAAGFTCSAVSAARPDGPETWITAAPGDLELATLPAA